MKLTSLLAVACVVTSTAFAQELTWPDLARRPEIWPAQCTVKRAMKFAQESVSAPKDVLDRVAALKEQGRKNALLMLSSKTGELRFVTVRMD